MEKKVGIGVSGSEQCDGGGDPPATQQPPLGDAIDELRDSFASWMATFAAKYDSAVANVKERAKALRLAEEKAEQGMKELDRKRKELQKEVESVNRKSAEVDAREAAFELLMKKEVADWKKQAEERCSEEAELEEKRRRLDAKEKEIEECSHRFRMKEKGFEQQLAEFQVRLSELNSREKVLAEQERQWREIESNAKHCCDELRVKENEFERRVIEFNRKVVKPDLRLAELSKKERELHEKEKRSRELELKLQESSTELEMREMVLMGKYSSLDEQIKDVELKEKKLEERIRGFDAEKGEISAEGVVEDSRLAELSEKERELDGKEKRSRELELRLVESSTELEMREMVLRGKHSILDERIRDVELKERKLEERLRELDAEEGEILAEGVVEDSQLKEKRFEEMCTESELKEGEKLVKSLSSGQYSGAKRSWSDASENGNLIESPGPASVTSGDLPAEHPERSNVPAQQLERVNVPAQQPERSNIPVQQPEKLNMPDQQPERLNEPVQHSETLSSDQAGCSNPFPINSKHSGSGNETDPLPSQTLLEPKCIAGCTRLKLLYGKIETNTLHCSEISDALKLASDPGEFVLGAVKNPSSLTLKRGNEAVRLASPQYGPLLLLDRLWRMSPHVKPDVEREALSFARKWRSKLPNQMNSPMEPVCFLLFLSAYKLVSHFHQGELFSVFGKGHWCLYSTKLFGILGFKDLIPKFLEYLMRNKLLMETLQSINVSTLLKKSPSAKTLLNNYLHLCPKKLRGTEGIGQQIKAIDRALNVWKAVAESIADQNLTDSFRAHILALEKQKEEKLQAQHSLDAIAGPPPTPKLSENQQPGRQQQQGTPASSKAERQHDTPASSKPDSDPITTSAASSSPSVAQDESKAHKKCRGVVESLNALQRAPPLGSNNQKVHPPQQPLQFTGGRGNSLRPAPTAVYPDPPFRFPVPTFPWSQQTHDTHASSKADANPITTSAASSSLPVAQDESRARKKRRKVVEPLNALQRAPPLGSNNQKVHPPQQPLQFTGRGGSFRPAAMFVYPDPPFGLPVLTFPWLQQTPFRYLGHGSFLQTRPDAAPARGPDDVSGAPEVEALPSAEASVSIAQTGGESASPSSSTSLQVGLSLHGPQPSEPGPLTRNLIEISPRPFSFGAEHQSFNANPVGNPQPFSPGAKHQNLRVFSSFAEATTASSGVASAPRCLATRFGSPTLSKCTGDSPASSLVLAENVKDTGTNPYQPEE